MARKALAAAVIWGCALALASAALAGNGGIAPPDSVTDSGSAINRIYWFLFGICALIFLAVEGALVWFVFRFRRRRSVEYGRDAPQIHGNTRLEVVWTAIPLAIVIVIAAVAFATVPTVNANPSHASDVLPIRVDAHQFYWQYTYPNGAISLDTLRIPVGRKIQLELHSQDVAHSWWVNEITGKRDAIPGRTQLPELRGQGGPGRSAASVPSSAASCTPSCTPRCRSSRPTSTRAGFSRPGRLESGVAKELRARQGGVSAGLRQVPRDVGPRRHRPRHRRQDHESGESRAAARERSEHGEPAVVHAARRTRLDRAPGERSLRVHDHHAGPPRECKWRLGRSLSPPAGGTARR